MKITNCSQFFDNLQKEEDAVFNALRVEYEILNENHASTGCYMLGDKRPLILSLYSIAKSRHEIVELQEWKVELLLNFSGILFKK